MSDENDDLLEGSEEFERKKAEERKRLGVVFGCGLAVFALIWLGTGCAPKTETLRWVDYASASPDLKHSQIMLPEEAKEAVLKMKRGSLVQIRRGKAGWEQVNVVGFLDPKNFWKDF